MGIERTAARVERVDHLRSFRDVVLEQPRVPEVVLVPVRTHDVRLVDPSLVRLHQPVRLVLELFRNDEHVGEAVLVLLVEPGWTRGYVGDGVDAQRSAAMRRACAPASAEGHRARCRLRTRVHCGNGEAALSGFCF